jgi:hypothetical protein
MIKKSAQQKKLYFLVTKHKMIFNYIKKRKFYICIQTNKNSLKLDVWDTYKWQIKCDDHT